MTDVLLALVNKLPSGYIMTLLPFLVVIAVWLLMRLKRDKQGKIYFYSHAYEARKHDKKLDAICEEQQKASHRLLRVELLHAMHYTPEKAEVIMGLYDAYKSDGGNSYIDEVFRVWKEKHAAKVIENRV